MPFLIPVLLILLFGLLAVPFAVAFLIGVVKKQRWLKWIGGVGAVGILLVTVSLLGLFFYGTSGKQAVSFQGGTLCAKAPLVRTALQNSGGTPPCGGTFSTRMLVPSASVDAIE